jgi:hypothetical protein
VLVVLVAACNEQDTHCRRPIMVSFRSCDGYCPSSVPPTLAVGGTWRVTPTCAPAQDQCAGNGMYCSRVRLDVPYTADDAGGPAIRVVDAELDVGVTVTAVRSGTNTISIFGEDGTWFGGEELAAMDVESVELVPHFGDTIPAGASLAFSTDADGDIVVALRNNGTVLRDSALGLALPVGADRLDVDRFAIHGVAEGTYVIDVTVGAMLWTVQLDVANRADAVSPQDPPAVVDPGPSTTMICFAATTLGRAITGLSWSYFVDGVTSPAHRNFGNCVTVHPMDDLPPLGSLTVSATAGGATSPTMTLPIAPP